MADVNIEITGLQVFGDKVFVTGTVDGAEVKAETWLSHLYPPKGQDPASAARGCQDDDQRKSHLADVLLTAGGFVQTEELVDKVKQSLQALVTKPEKSPVVIDPTVP